MGWRGIRRDFINVVKRSATASRKERERSERARLKAMRSEPLHAHYPQAPQGYSPLPGPTWAAPTKQAGPSGALALVAVLGSLLLCGTCSMVIASAPKPSTREDTPAAPRRDVIGVAASAPRRPTPVRAPAVVRSIAPAPPPPRAPAPVAAPPSGPRCCDGSPARCTGRGCCSHHGGVCG